MGPGFLGLPFPCCVTCHFPCLGLSFPVCEKGNGSSSCSQQTGSGCAYWEGPHTGGEGRTRENRVSAGGQASHPPGPATPKSCLGLQVPQAPSPKSQPPQLLRPDNTLWQFPADRGRRASHLGPTASHGLQVPQPCRPHHHLADSKSRTTSPTGPLPRGRLRTPTRVPWAQEGMPSSEANNPAGPRCTSVG